MFLTESKCLQPCFFISCCEIQYAMTDAKDVVLQQEESLAHAERSSSVFSLEPEFVDHTDLVVDWFY